STPSVARPGAHIGGARGYPSRARFPSRGGLQLCVPFRGVGSVLEGRRAGGTSAHPRLPWLYVGAQHVTPVLGHVTVLSRAVSRVATPYAHLVHGRARPGRPMRASSVSF